MNRPTLDYRVACFVVLALTWMPGCAGTGSTNGTDPLQDPQKEQPKVIAEPETEEEKNAKAEAKKAKEKQVAEELAALKQAEAPQKADELDALKKDPTHFSALPPGSKYGWGTSLGRFTYGFYTGVILSKEQSDFSEVDPFVRFRSDLSFNRKKDFELDNNLLPTDRSVRCRPTDFHTFLDLAFTSLPAQAIENGNAFFESKKAFVGAAGIDYRLLHWTPISGFEEFKLVVAPSAFAGLQTFTEELTQSNRNADLRDTVTERWGIGLKFMGIQQATVGTGATAVGHPNPLPRHFFAAYYGDDEAAGNKRLMLDSALVLSGDSGMFVGFGASLGRGVDDVRVIFGFATTLQKLFDSVSSFVPDIVK